MRVGCWWRQFLAIWVAASETSDIRPAILYGDMLLIVGWWQIEWPWMTLNDLEWLFHANLGFVPEVLDSECSAFSYNCVKTNKLRFILSVAKIYVNNSSFWQYYGVSCWDVFKPVWGCWNRRICRLPVAISSYISEITSSLILHFLTTHCSGFLPAPIRMTLNARFNL